MQLKGVSEEEMPGNALPGFVLLSINVQTAGEQHALSRDWAEERNSNSRLSCLLPNVGTSTASISAGQRRTTARDGSCECLADTGLEEMSK